MQIFLFFALFIAAVAILFAAQNNTQVTVSFLAWETQGSLALVLLISLAAGAAISFFFSLPANIKTRWTIRQQRKKMNELEQDLAEAQVELATARSVMEEPPVESIEGLKLPPIEPPEQPNS